MTHLASEVVQTLVYNVLGGRILQKLHRAYQRRNIRVGEAETSGVRGSVSTNRRHVLTDGVGPFVRGTGTRPGLADGFLVF